MHFWIDKRSQTCGFGRARVGASLGGGGGVGLGFGPPSRRFVTKPPNSATIHRLQSNNETSRCRPTTNSNNNNSHNIINNRINSSSNNNNSGAPISTNNNNLHRNNRNRSNHSSSSSSPYQQRRHQQQQQQQSSYHHTHPNSHQNRHQHRHQNNPVDHHSPHNLPRAPVQLLTVNNQDYHIPVALPYSYGSPSHAPNLEQGSLGVESLSIRTNDINTNHHHTEPTIAEGHVEVSTEPQLIPPHLKCGMCASLVLASIFIAGTKYYFDYQEGGVDSLIFCVFAITSLMIMCLMMTCRYAARDLAVSPSISIDGHSRVLDVHLQNRGLDGPGHIPGSPHPQIYSQNSDQNVQDLQFTHSPVISLSAVPPPPYHIAILLPPENDKEIQSDESPPPSYDKLLIE